VRPLRLTVDGFTCFRERQGPIDLSALEVFAITGVTGAGKSSLLDAMVFALYGKVPRLAGRGCSELIALGRDRMSVTLDFGVENRAFRVTRVARRRGATDVIIEELTNGQERPLGGGVRETERQIEALLGLGYEAFIQAVVLPQGRFAQFLQSKPGERQAILRDLLRLQVYERMRGTSGQRSRDLESEVRNLEERLEHDYAGATPEALAALATELAALNEHNVSLTAELESAEAMLADIETRHRWTTELRSRRSEIHNLVAREPEARAAEERLSRARLAAPVMVHLEAAAERRSAAAQATRERDATTEAHQRTRTAHERAAATLEGATEQAQHITGLDERIRRLDEIKGVVAARERARELLNRKMAELDAAQARAKASQEAVTQTEALVAKLAEEECTAKAALETLAYDPDRHRILDASRDDIASLTQLRKEALSARTRAEQAAKRQLTAQKEADRTEANASEAQRQHEDARRVLEQAQAARIAATHQHAAADLRAGLRPGEACPVCNQRVTTLPPAIDVPELKTLELKLKEAQRTEARLRELEEEATAARVHAAAAAAQGSEQCDEASRETERLASLFAAGEARLEKAVGSIVAGTSGDTLEARCQETLQQLTAVRSRHEEARAQLDAAERRMIKARSELDARRERLEAAHQGAAEGARAHLEIKTELAGFEAEIAAVTSHSDPSAEREALAGEATALQKALELAQQREAELRSELASAAAQAVATSDLASRLDREAAESGAKAERAAADAGFADLAAVSAAALQAPEEKRLEIHVREYREARSQVEGRIADLEVKLSGRDVSEEHLGEARATVDRLRSQREASIGNAVALDTRIKELQKRTKAAAQLSTRLDACRSEHLLYARLAQDLRADGFQAYVLEEVFREMVHGASQRLLELSSGRYAFAYHESAFHVLDHDNARERRSADTLSGGETFLASLALALELSEQVQRSAGAVRLDSIFIDEGFGTLDPETLETVATAIESLPVGGRMVGIISHVPELTQRLPARLVVEKRAQGSCVIGPLET
jgi:exonuclease SbcC